MSRVLVLDGDSPFVQELEADLAARGVAVAVFRDADPALLDDLDVAARFWSSALGMPVVPPASDAGPYRRLDAGPRDLVIEVQKVQHASRVHVDIETDDIEAEVARLERLGATRVERGKRWWVMQAPTGQRLCVVAASDAGAGGGFNAWE